MTTDTEVAATVVALQPAPEFQWIVDAGGPAVAWKPMDGGREAIGLPPGWEKRDYLLEKDERPRPIVRHAEGPEGFNFQYVSPPHARGDQITWESSFKVGEGRYVRAYGTAADFASAVSSVENWKPVSRLAGGVTWWSTGRSWVTWLGGLAIEVRQSVVEGQEGKPWRLLIEGQAPTLEEAMVLAVLGRRD